MKLFPTRNFAKNYRKLPQHIQNTTDKQLVFLLFNPKHPSLNIKKMDRPGDIWEARITGSYRFTFQINNDAYILRNVGTHDILKRP